MHFVCIDARSTSAALADKMSPMLRLQNLRKSYGAFTALHGLDLSVERGEILALLGPNGAGKSTTVRCITGLQTQDGGTIETASTPPRIRNARAARRATCPNCRDSTTR